MRLRPLIFAVGLIAIAATLARTAATRDGVGALEYVIVGAMIGVLLIGSYRLSRRAIRRI